MIKQNHFPNVAAVTTLFVVLLGSGMNEASAATHAKVKPHNKVHVNHRAHRVHHARHVEQGNKIVTDKHSKLSKKTKKPVKLVPPKKPVIHKQYKATGIASWYGYESGKKTASGKRFNPLALTAAHRSLPMPSRVKVTNLENKKSVIVTVNDRGPYHKSRIIDLSLASARAIDLKGVGRVKIESIN